MASGSIELKSEQSDYYSGVINWSSTTNNSENYSEISVQVYVILKKWGIQGTGAGQWKENGNTVNTFSPAVNIPWGGNGTVLVYSKSGIRVDHNSNGDGSITLGCDMQFSFAGISNIGGSETIYMDHIDRYATLSASQKSKDINSISINWSADHTISGIKYSADGGKTYSAYTTISAKSGTLIIKNLSPNTSYNIKVRVKRNSNSLETTSDTLTIKTYDYAKFTNISNSNFGDNISVTKTNESDLNNNLELYVGTSLITSRTSIANSYTLSLTQSELDNLYKKYGVNVNTLSCTYKLITICNSVNYTNTLTKTITLTGNAKTAKIKQNGTIKRAKVFIKQDGVVKKGVLFIKQDGTIKRCI